MVLGDVVAVHGNWVKEEFPAGPGEGPTQRVPEIGYADPSAGVPRQLPILSQVNKFR